MEEKMEELVLVDTFKRGEIEGFFANKIKFLDKLRKLASDLEFKRMKEEVFSLIDLESEEKKEFCNLLNEVIITKVKSEIMQIAYKETIISGKPLLLNDEYLSSILQPMCLYKALSEIKEGLEFQNGISELFKGGNEQEAIKELLN